MFDRPDRRPLKALPALERERTSLETCTFCPKLCRGACPVSEAEPNEALTPWGKMSEQYFAARGDAEDSSMTRLAYACTGCLNCREQCDHKNPVAATLQAARAAHFTQGQAPAEIRSLIERAESIERQYATLVADATKGKNSEAQGQSVFVFGTALLADPALAQTMVNVVAKLAGPSRWSVVSPGTFLYDAGNVDAFFAHAQRFIAQLGSASAIYFTEPGCAYTYREHAEKLGIGQKRVATLVDFLFEHLHALSAVEAPPLRYHDPCKLGRGLGVYAQPRAILSRVAGRAPLEFPRHHERGMCSGGGGVFSVVYSELSQKMAKARLDEPRDFRDAREARTVTACASSLRSFRTQGEADHLVDWVARSLSAHE